MLDTLLTIGTMSALTGRKDGQTQPTTNLELIMVLKRKAPDFEAQSEQAQQDAAVQETQEAATAKAVSPDANPEAPWDPAEVAETPKPAATKALVSQPKGALVAQNNPKVNINVVKNLKDQYPVQYDSLAQISATQGRFTDRESGTNLGTELLFELLSYQDQYVVSPNDDKAPKDVVKYSSDSVTCSDGTDVKTYVNDLREMGWKNARINARYVIVGALVQAEKTADFDGLLMQIDLSPKSKSQFDRYLIQSAFDLAKGKITEEQAKLVDIVAEVTENAAKQSYTICKFSSHTAD